MCPHRTQGGTMVFRTLSPWGVHIGAVLSSTAVGQILAGVAQVLIVRTLGVSGYGQYALLYAWLAVASALLGAGLDTWLLDSQSRQHAILGSAVRRILTIKISVWVVFGAIAAVWIPNLPAQVADRFAQCHRISGVARPKSSPAGSIHPTDWSGRVTGGGTERSSDCTPSHCDPATRCRMYHRNMCRVVRLATGWQYQGGNVGGCSTVCDFGHLRPVVYPKHDHLGREHDAE